MGFSPNLPIFTEQMNARGKHFITVWQVQATIFPRVCNAVPLQFILFELKKKSSKRDVV